MRAHAQKEPRSCRRRRLRRGCPRARVHAAMCIIAGRDKALVLARLGIVYMCVRSMSRETAAVCRDLFLRTEGTRGVGFSRIHDDGSEFLKMRVLSERMVILIVIILIFA